MVNALLGRVGADRSMGGGSWNGPIDAQSGNFAYVAIPETRTVHPGTEKPYSALMQVVSTFGLSLPPHFCTLQMRLDPDFEHLTLWWPGQTSAATACLLFSGRLDCLLRWPVRWRSETRLRNRDIFVVEDFIRSDQFPAHQCGSERGLHL